MHSFSAAAAAGSYDPQLHPLSAQGSLASLDGASAFAGASGVAGHTLTAALPQSGMYASSCRAFTWPLLAPQSQVSIAARARVVEPLQSVWLAGGEAGAVTDRQGAEVKCFPFFDDA